MDNEKGQSVPEELFEIEECELIFASGGEGGLIGPDG